MNKSIDDLDPFIINLYLQNLRRAHHFSTNPVFHNRLQVKYNRARKGELKNGDDLPIIPSLHNKIKPGVNVIIGSSQT